MFAKTCESYECVSALGATWLWDLVTNVKPDLIIFDNIMSLTVSDLRDEEGWKAIMPWIKSLTARRIGQLWIIHTGHDKTLFREQIVDKYG